MATTVVYNGVTILDCLTEDIDQQIVYDGTDTDPIGVHVRVTVHGTVHTTAGVSTHGYGHTGTLAAGLSVLAEALMKPRRGFTMSIAGTTLFDIRPGASDTSAVKPSVMMAQNDINNGPRPTLKINQIIGGATAKVTFTVEFTVPNCPNSANDGILNLRFWIADDIDGDSWTTVRTYHGRVRLAHSMLNPHAFRNLCVPVLLPGFQRKRVNMTASPNGLELEFTIVDQELMAMAPAPASTWSGWHIVSSPQPGGILYESEVAIQLTGPKNVSTKDLLGLAARILDAKLHLNDQQRDGKLFLLRSTFKTSFRDNSVEANAACKLTDTPYILNNLLNSLGEPLTLPQYNDQFAASHAATASPAGLFLSAIQTPCNPARMPQVPVVRPSDPEKTKSAADETEPTITEAPLVTYDTKYSQSHQKNVYTFYNSSNDYDIDAGVVSMPVGSSSRSGATSVLCQLYPASATRVLRVEAERLNAWPELPAPASFTDPNGITHTLVNPRPMPNAPLLSGDARKTLNSTNFELTYALSRAPTAAEALPVGQVPTRSVMSNESVLRNMPATVFVAPGTQGSIV